MKKEFLSRPYTKEYNSGWEYIWNSKLLELVKDLKKDLSKKDTRGYLEKFEKIRSEEENPCTGVKR